MNKTIASLWILAGLSLPVVASTTVPTTTYNSGDVATVLDGTSIQTGSGATVTVSAGAGVGYEAGSSITLNPGFDAKPGSFFLAFIASDATPGEPVDLSATSEATTYVSLAWVPSTDTTGGIYYKVYNGGTQIATTTVPYFTVDGLDGGTTYSYYVMAYDSAGNASPASSTFSVTTVAYSAISGESPVAVLFGSSVTTSTDSNNYIQLQVQRSSQ